MLLKPTKPKEKDNNNNGDYEVPVVSSVGVFVDRWRFMPL